MVAFTVKTGESLKSRGSSGDHECLYKIFQSRPKQWVNSQHLHRGLWVQVLAVVSEKLENGFVNTHKKFEFSL